MSFDLPESWAGRRERCFRDIDFSRHGGLIRGSADPFTGDLERESDARSAYGEVAGGGYLMGKGRATGVSRSLLHYDLSRFSGWFLAHSLSSSRVNRIFLFDATLVMS